MVYTALRSGLAPCRFGLMHATCLVYCQKTELFLYLPGFVSTFGAPYRSPLRFVQRTAIGRTTAAWEPSKSADLTLFGAAISYSTSFAFVSKVSSFVTAPVHQKMPETSGWGWRYILFKNTFIHKGESTTIFINLPASSRVLLGVHKHSVQIILLEAPPV